MEQNNPKENAIDSKYVNRRNALKIISASGLATAAHLNPLDAHPSLAASASTSPDGTFSLPLNTHNTHNFEIFLRALNDKHVREGLLKQRTTLPKSVLEIIELIDDRQFVSLAHATYKTYQLFTKGEATEENLRTRGQLLNEYVSTMYPEGMKALYTYIYLAHPEYKKVMSSSMSNVEHPQSSSPAAAINVAVVANLGGVVNIDIYVNGVIATNVVLVAVVAVGIAIVAA